MSWTVETLDERVDKELNALPRKLYARFIHVSEMLEESGPNAVGMPHIRHLSDGLWEMRMKGPDGIARAVFVKAVEQRIVVVHVFIKKAQKTQKRALDTARERAKEVV